MRGKSSVKYVHSYLLKDIVEKTARSQQQLNITIPLNVDVNSFKQNRNCSSCLHAPTHPNLAKKYRATVEQFHQSQYAAVGRARMGHNTDYDRTPNEASSMTIQPESKL